MLAFTRIAPPHALLVAYWASSPRARIDSGAEEAESVRTGSGFWAVGYDSSHGSSTSFASQLLHLVSPHSAASLQIDDSDGKDIAAGSNNDGSGAPARTSALTRGHQHQQQQWRRRRRRTDDAEAPDAFVAGMIHAPSRRLLPSLPRPRPVSRARGRRGDPRPGGGSLTSVSGACAKGCSGLNGSLMDTYRY